MKSHNFLRIYKKKKINLHLDIVGFFFRMCSLENKSTIRKGKNVFKICYKLCRCILLIIDLFNSEIKFDSLVPLKSNRINLNENF